MSQNCPETKTLRLDPNSMLSFKCGSSCDTGKFEWYWRTRGQREEMAVKLDQQDPSLTIQSVGYKDGGIYTCQCLPDGPKCDQHVHSKSSDMHTSLPPFHCYIIK